MAQGTKYNKMLFRSKNAANLENWKMTKEQINITIAESSGWHPHPDNDRSDQKFWTTGNSYGVPEKGKPFKIAAFPSLIEDFHNHIYYNLPNYSADLNAMHEAEKSITDPRKMLDYFNHLSRYNDPDAQSIQDSFNIITATALQRAEAYLRTIGKWKEE